MRKKIACALFIAFIFSVLGCSAIEEQLPDTYVEGSDYQYMYTRSGPFPIFQKGKDGYYLLWNNHIYFYDEESQMIVPLCSKPDCLHDKETDQTKREACYAYASTDTGNGLAYCNENLYYIDSDYYTSSTSRPTLYRFAPDGSSKEKLYEWKDKANIPSQWLVHRDVLYYTVQSYYTEDDNINEYLAFYALPLTGKDKLKPKQIYIPEEEGVDIVILGNPTAYGNYVYFTTVGNYVYEDKKGNSSTKTFVYNIQTEEIDEITVPGQTEAHSIGGVNFWQDKIIFALFDQLKDYSGEGTYYIADLDGSDPEIAFTTDYQIYSVFSDGKYLYRSNVDFREEVDSSGPKLYHVYDEDLNEIDTFTTDDAHNTDFPIGMPDRSYGIYYKDSGEWGIETWDKSTIGNLNGSEIEFTDIPYEGSLQE